MSLLSKIEGPQDVKNMSIFMLKQLAEEVRVEMINTVSKNGGHLAPNLGVVELTLALHKVFHTPQDKIIWDVGHQCYIHKLVTGRRRNFNSLRKHGGISGFPNPKESEHDAFITGHSSTSLSVALGMAISRDIKGNNNSVVAVIGDGAMTGGMAFEAMNNAGHLQQKMIVILNDNEMSIAKNVGGMSRYLTRLRTDPKYSRGKEELENIMKKIPGIGNKVFKAADRIKDSLKYLLVHGMLFEELGFTYLGPIDGHSMEDMVEVMTKAKDIPGPVLIHTITKKGKGYPPAEKNPGLFHGIGPFDIETGIPYKSSNIPSYTQIAGSTLCVLAEADQSIVAITAAMTGGTGLSEFAERFPKRFFDVGIAEQHAVTMAAAMATEDLKPVVVVYSTFLQRAYDQVIHDLCLQNLPVTLLLDRSGLVGDDGPTHHGLFDLAFLGQIPNMAIMAPKDENELQHMINTAVKLAGPAAVRYPRGAGVGCSMDEQLLSLPFGKSQVLKEGNDLAIFAVGAMVEIAEKAADQLSKLNISAAVINVRYVKPIDRDMVINYGRETGSLITLEEGILEGGFGSRLLRIINDSGLEDIEVKTMGIPDQFIEHGNRDILLQEYGLTVEKTVNNALELMEKKSKAKSLEAIMVSGGKGFVR